jgi:Tfp pilus assembly protein FimT
MVVVLIGLAAALSIPPISRIRTNFALDEATQQLQSDLRRAQSEAVRRNRQVNVTRVNDSTYRLAVNGAGGAVIGDRRLPAPVKFGTGTATTLQIRSYGQPIEASTVYVLTLNSRQRSVRMNAMGRVSVSAGAAL